MSMIFLRKPNYNSEVFVINTETKLKWTNVRDFLDKLLFIDIKQFLFIESFISIL